MCSHNLEMCRLNGLSTLDIPSLMHWCDEINNMLHLVPLVIFKHTYREHNMLANGLSKQALNLDMGYGTFFESLDGMVIEHGQFILF